MFEGTDMNVIEKVIVTKNNPVSDFAIEEWFDSVIKSGDKIVEVSTSVMLDRMMLAVLEGAVSTFKIESQVEEGKECYVNEIGSTKTFFFYQNVERAIAIQTKRCNILSTKTHEERLKLLQKN